MASALTRFRGLRIGIELAEGGRSNFVASSKPKVSVSGNPG